MIVYLDSQDYSRFADPRYENDKQIANLRGVLAAAAQKNLHRFPFSNLHVQEAVHTDDSSKELAVGRARQLKQLSCHCTFAPLEHLLMREVFLACKEKGITVSDAPIELAVVRNGAIWWPWEALSNEGPLDFRTGLEVQLRALGLNKVMNRGRENAKARMALEVAIGRFVDAKLPEVALWITENFPCSPKMLDHAFLRRFLLGKVDQSEFLNELLDQALDVETFVAWTVDKLDGAKRAASYVKTSGYELTERYTELVGTISSNWSQLASDETNAELNAIRDNGIANVAATVRKSLISVGTMLLFERGVFKRGLNSDDVARELAETSSEEMRGIEVITGCFRAWMALVTSPSSNRQKILRSDVLDILHSAYLPYVDCFRVDGRFENILRQSKCGYLSKVESSLMNLPSRLALE